MIGRGGGGFSTNQPMIRVAVLLLLLSINLFSEDRFAIVIGNSEYEYISKLPMVPKDIRSVSDKFNSLGYSVFTLDNYSKNEIEDFVTKLQYVLTYDSTVILYYAGHGIEYDGRDYIVTRTISLEKDSLSSSSVEVGWLIRSLFKSNSSTILLFIDACRNNPFPSKKLSRGIKTVNRNLLKDGTKKRLGVVHSTSSGEYAYDSVEGYDNSPFATAFLRNISIPNETLVSLLENISIDVGLITKGKQVIESKVDFKEKIVLNRSDETKVAVTKSHNSLTIGGYGKIKIKANNSCVAVIDDGSDNYFDKGEEKSFDFKVGEYVVKLNSLNKKDLVKVKVEEGKTTLVVFSDETTPKETTDLNDIANYVTPDFDYVKDVVAGIPFDMVLVEAGQFKMGSYDITSSNSSIYSVEITKDYLISKTEVTQLLYKTITGKAPSLTFGKDLPVENLDWYDAVEFCNKLSEKAGLSPAYKISKFLKDPNNSNKYDKKKWNVTLIPGSKGYRLPTEAQWEYAARGGKDGKLQNFSGSSNLRLVGWYSENSESQVQEVATLRPNELGIYDLSGNVLEWCFDWRRPYNKSKTVDPEGSKSGKSRVIRGGGITSIETNSNVGYRGDQVPFSGSGLIGLRIIRPVSK